MEFLKNHKIIAVVIFIIIAFVVYAFLTGDDEESLLVESISGVSEAAVIEEDLLSLLFDLRSLTLDGSIFESETFQGLVDFGKELVLQPVGRLNPFAPIGVGTGILSNENDEGSGGEE